MVLCFTIFDGFCKKNVNVLRKMPAFFSKNGLGDVKNKNKFIDSEQDLIIDFRQPETIEQIYYFNS